MSSLIKADGGEMNRMANSSNPFQGNSRRVVCCCSAGLLRSPTAAVVLNTEMGWNTRSCGLEDNFAPIKLDKTLAYWADMFVVMTDEHKEMLERKLEGFGFKPTEFEIKVLGIEDSFRYMDPELIGKIVKWAKSLTSHTVDDTTN